MPKTVAVLATLDTKGEECRYLRERVEALGGQALLIDLGVVGPAAVAPDVPREEVVAAAGRSWREVALHPTRQSLAPVLIEPAGPCLPRRRRRCWVFHRSSSDASRPSPDRPWTGHEETSCRKEAKGEGRCESAQDGAPRRLR